MRINNICAKWKSLDIIFSSLFFVKKNEKKKTKKKTLSWYVESTLNGCFCWLLLLFLLHPLCEFNLRQNINMLCIYKWSTMNSGGRSAAVEMIKQIEWGGERDRARPCKHNGGINISHIYARLKRGNVIHKTNEEEEEKSTTTENKS